MKYTLYDLDGQELFSAEGERLKDVLVKAVQKDKELPRLYLRDHELSYVNLASLQAPGAVIHGSVDHSDLSYADLSGATLRLHGHLVDLHNADLSQSDMRNSSLIRSNFEDADMAGVNLRGSDISDSNFTDAKLKDARFDFDNHDAIAAVLRYHLSQEYNNTDMTSNEFNEINRILVSIPYTRGWCWRNWLLLGHQRTNWALEKLAEHLTRETYLGCAAERAFTRLGLWPLRPNYEGEVATATERSEVY